MPSPASDNGRDAPASLLEWQIASDLREIAAIVEAVSRACTAAGFPAKACRLNIPVALTEALANAIECGNGSDASRLVRVRARIDAVRLLLEVTDEGTGFDSAAARARCEEPGWVTGEDGRGVFLMYSLMDEVENWCDAGHTVRLVLHR